jgi:cytochrome c oxidase subunit 4
MSNEHDAHAEGHEGHKIPGLSRYFGVYFALLVFTVLTVTLAKIDLGSSNLTIALVIAVTKATLVALFFMHLWDHGGANRMVFGVSILFLFVLLAGTYADLHTRFALAVPHGAHIENLEKYKPKAHGAGHGSHDDHTDHTGHSH